MASDEQAGFPAATFEDVPLDGGYVDALDFESVPAADALAVVDPFWLELRGDSLLPTAYMPPTMSGHHSSFLRVVATGLIGVFLLATTLGVCLTYGPP